MTINNICFTTGTVIKILANRTRNKFTWETSFPAKAILDAEVL